MPWLSAVDGRPDNGRRRRPPTPTASWPVADADDRLAAAAAAWAAAPHGQSLMRVHWVGVPGALRARRVNTWAASPRRRYETAAPYLLRHIIQRTGSQNRR
eukprot:COSAG01_NODE_6245_length_3772_cov_12.433433_5_plen_101_part_00